MCTYIVEKAAIVGSAKGPHDWMKVDTANIYYDHPQHAQLDHALNIDFVNVAGGSSERVAVELSAASARELVKKILAALTSGPEDATCEQADQASGDQAVDAALRRST
jgi:hypothetical protein